MSCTTTELTMQVFLPPSFRKTKARAKELAARVAVAGLLAAAGSAHAGAGPIQGVVTGVNIVLATVTAVCLALATIGVGITAYKIMFEGANFRDMTKMLLGAAIAGSAGTIAGMFMVS